MVILPAIIIFCQAWEHLGEDNTRFQVPERYRNVRQITDNEPLSLFLPEPFNREGICSLHVIDVSDF